MSRRELVAGLIAIAAANGETGKLGDQVVSNGKTETHPFGTVTVLMDGPTDRLKSMTAGVCLLHPGQEPHPPHQHPEEEIMFVTEGSGIIIAAGKDHAVSPGSLMYCEGDHVHGIKNTGSGPMKFFYLKWLA